MCVGKYNHSIYGIDCYMLKLAIANLIVA